MAGLPSNNAKFGGISILDQSFPLPPPKISVMFVLLSSS
jgi:hypothetical protein